MRKALRIFAVAPLLRAASGFSKSPENVPIAYAIPMVHNAASPPIQDCIRLPGTVAHNAMLRSSAGIDAFSLELRCNATTMLENSHPKDLRIIQSRQQDAVARMKEPVMMCGVRANVQSLNEGKHFDFNEALCRCRLAQQSSEMCADIEDFVVKTQCRSDYEPGTGYCAAIGASDKTFSVAIPDDCTALLAGSVSFLSLRLEKEFDIDETAMKIEESIVLTEGPAYYLAWKALQRFTGFTEAEFFCAESVKDVEILPSYENQLYIYAREIGESKQVPVAALALREIDETFILTIRDATTSFEGRLSATTSHALTHLAEFPGAVHEGYALMAESMFPSLSVFFHQWFLRNWDPHRDNLMHPRILVVGQGQFGGGVGALVAYRLAKYFQRSDVAGTTRSKARVDAILFGATNVGNAEFALAYRSMVNGRNIVSRFHMDFFPCETQQGCEVNTTIPTGTGPYTYSPLGGLIEIDPETEPILEDSLEYFSHGHAALHFPAQSICLPGCWVTKSFCKYDTVDMCDPSTCSVLAKTSPDVC
eukprot:Polyplicarium_translucidae@DN1587_c0_g1_i2.p1